jgi:hypothetical protein
MELQGMNFRTTTALGIAREHGQQLGCDPVNIFFDIMCTTWQIGRAWWCVLWF